MAGSSSSLNLGIGNRVAVLNIDGVIGEGPGYQANTKVLSRQVREWAKSSSVKAMVLRINSPGGAVSATQDLYQAIEEFKATGKPVVASYGDISASGGFYAGIAADEIYANPGTLTGSIGVVLNFFDLQGLQEKIGFRSRPIKSGEFKDIGSSSRDMTEEEKALLEEMVIDVYEQFLDAIVTSREDAIRNILSNDLLIPPSEVTKTQIEEYVRQYADGRIFSGRQAHIYGFVDSLGTLQDAVNRAASLAGLEGKPSVTEAPVRPRGLFGMASLLNRKAHEIEVFSPGTVKLEYRFEGF